ncbi:YceI family protein [Vitiosangium sp. GDMCC 1.1324]|uniref:YceI family protein n=1 Tax=Vitiosangium sp. (strain GDMCC 1.1324) TaxID=2138576 RepID=UPI000D3572EF|nr:YceI family protein [Vitiosangium sp. GDMCC 1.1324]PTL79606.1 YceI family protein [Vitiosangium sp. GDMCC 1.1324]
MKRSLLAVLAPLLLSAPSLAQEAANAPRLYSVNNGDSSITYHLKHKLHVVDGTAHPAEGKARILPDGTLQVAVRANVADFDSGNANRDAHMKEATEAAKFPTIEFKGVASGVKVPASFPSEQSVVVKGQLTFHGVKQPVEVPMKVVFTSAKEVTAESKFQVSLESFKVERPSLLMVQVDDALDMETKFKLKEEGK